MLYTYVGGHISHVSDLLNEYEYDFTWSGDNLVTIYLSSQYGDYSYYDTTMLTYDNEHNPLQIQSGIELVGEWSGDYRMFLSANNVLQVHSRYVEAGYSGEEVRTYSYTYDDDGYPVSMTYTWDSDEPIHVTFTYYE